jgi:hypothetical protein
VQIKITQYGLSIKAGGWDSYGDSGTDKFQGDHNNTILNGTSCALTASARDGLGAQRGDLLRITFDNGYKYYRRYDDTAPESDPRLDMFNAWAFDKQVPAEFAAVEIVIVQ